MGMSDAEVQSAIDALNAGATPAPAAGRGEPVTYTADGVPVARPKATLMDMAKPLLLPAGVGGLVYAMTKRPGVAAAAGAVAFVLARIR